MTSPTHIAAIVQRPFQRVALRVLAAFVAYERRIFRDSVAWTVQFNVRNLNADMNGVVPIRAQPDGSYARVRSVTPRQFLLTNNFRF